jgi:hypothetical protein
LIAFHDKQVSRAARRRASTTTRFAYLLAKLDAVNEGAGTLLDNTLISLEKQEHAKLLVSVAQLMGLPTVNTVGDRQTSAGPLAGLL